MLIYQEPSAGLTFPECFSTILNLKVSSQAGESVQWVKCLPSKRENESPDPWRVSADDNLPVIPMLQTHMGSQNKLARCTRWISGPKQDPAVGSQWNSQWMCVADLGMAKSRTNASAPWSSKTSPMWSSKGQQSCLPIQVQMLTVCLL